MTDSNRSTRTSEDIASRLREVDAFLRSNGFEAPCIGEAADIIERLRKESSLWRETALEYSRMIDEFIRRVDSNASYLYNQAVHEGCIHKMDDTDLGETARYCEKCRNFIQQETDHD